MSQPARHLAIIDDSLRFALFGLECALNVEFVVKEVERIFHDALADQIAAKEYQLLESKGVRVSGLVDEYEPESIWIRVDGGCIEQSRLDELFHRARYQALRLERAGNTAKAADSSLGSDRPDD